MRDKPEVRSDFIRFANTPEDQWDLVQAALLVARTRYPDLEEGGYRAYLCKLAGLLRDRLEPDAKMIRNISEMNRLFFDEEKFRGDRQHYFDPDNSFLNRVIDRRLGIPITLSLLYMDVGRRAGLRLDGVAAPGHFMVRGHAPNETVFIDPFNNGRLMSQQECRREIAKRVPKGAAFEDAWLKPAGSRLILERLLRNLKAIYLSMNNQWKAFEMIEWIIILNPQALKERLDRGLIYEAMGNVPKAVADFEYYLLHGPRDDQAKSIERKLTVLKGISFTMH